MCQSKNHKSLHIHLFVTKNNVKWCLFILATVYISARFSSHVNYRPWLVLSAHR